MTKASTKSVQVKASVQVKTAPVPYETTLHVRDNCLCFHAQKAARVLARVFDEAMRPHGLTNGQFSVMMSLNRPEPASMGMVANFLAMDRTTLTAALKPLERRGFVTIKQDPQDRRSRLLTLTARGLSALAAAVPVWEEKHAEIEKLLGAMAPEDLRQGLRALS